MSHETGASPPSRDPLGQVRDDAQAIAAAVRTRTSEAVDGIQGKVAGATEEVKAQGAEILGTARERAEGIVEDGKAAGAEQASGFARAIRHAADDLEGSSPEVARHVRAAADSVQGISAALRDRTAGQLFQDVADFARRQPAAFFGAAALAGFALARFAKSSTDGVAGGSGHASGPGSAAINPNAAPGWVPDSRGHTARPATTAAASLGGAVAHRAGDAAPGSMPTASTDVTPPAGTATPPASGGHQSSPVPNERTGTPL
ncbi:hypothetical protein [Roseomonas sp. BN140053]|uniref:hypothetical protein n=1 Tax=Roseomonas sp. BN140053 TaxID=3391898 RepID=UPI0039E7B132